MLLFGRFFHNYFLGEAMDQFEQQYSEHRMLGNNEGGFGSDSTPSCLLVWAPTILGYKNQ